MVIKQDTLNHKANQRNRIEEYIQATKQAPLDSIIPHVEKLIQDTDSKIQWNPVTGTPQMIQGPLSMALEGSPFAAAREFLIKKWEAIGIKETLEDFLEVDVLSWGGFNHTRFQQTIEKIPMIGAEIQVSLDKTNAVKAFFGNFYKEIAPSTGESPISIERAIDIGREDLGGEIFLRGAIENDILWYPTTKGHRKSYQIKIPAVDPLGDWEYFIDIDNEKILDSYNMMCFSSTARGKVFKENPEKTPRVTTETLNNLNTPITKLEGKFCKVLNEDGTEAVAATSSANDLTFFYDPTNTHFDEVQVYYFVDRVYEYFKTLGFRGFTTKNRQGVLTGNVHVGDEYNNAYYSPMTGELNFGDGSGPPFGLYALSKSIDIVAHEFTHAIIDEYVSIYGTDGNALHEGYADYFACTISEDPNLGEYVIPGEGNYMRTLLNNKKYPGPSTEPHQKGEIWGGACWDLRTALGQEVSDYLIYGSILLLPSVPSFKDAKERLLFIDKEILEEQYSDTIKDIFEDKRNIPT